ncbi:ibr domain protein [Ichthyophthirius multifiliis]|uniref:Ibr domain protein n=1 Tax=Ichthyophthirius multifiliis TaxID=5932 RepID=G0R3D4_ICHMU|nr:ibr domain protein [Ichthyophthirius multifiliis]EGR28008.1 ibr domain protein [Ichthyophthirius multifiliis]|eukprot:XP_004027353.1 ibr domain protein [Ichthyophthirius multifiliis]
MNLNVDEFLKENTSYKICQICLSQVEENQMLFIQKVCHLICMDCFKNYLNEEIRISKVENMKCPHCLELLTDQIIQDNVDNQTYIKFRYFQKRVNIQKDPLKRFCPTINCENILQLENKNQQKIQCDQCQAFICTQCNRNYHEEFSCNQILEKEITILINTRDIQRCRKCKALVQKIEGCNHMTCSVCEYQWCWLCGDTYTQMHTMALNPFGCPMLQNGRFTVHNTQMWKIYCIRFWIFVLIIFLFPFALLFSGPAFLLGAYIELLRKYRNSTYLNCQCYIKYILFFLGIIIFLLGFILDVIFAVLLVPGIIYLFVLYIKERNRIISKANQRLQQRENNEL